MGRDYKNRMFKVHLIDLEVRNSEAEADEDHANSQTDLGVRTVE